MNQLGLSRERLDEVEHGHRRVALERGLERGLERAEVQPDGLDDGLVAGDLERAGDVRRLDEHVGRVDASAGDERVVQHEDTRAHGRHRR